MKASPYISTRLVSSCLGAIALLALATFVPSATAAPCPNEALRTAQGSTSLPGCMALEMVSPPKKFSQPALLPSFSKDGERVLTLIRMALADNPGYQTYEGDYYVGLRKAAGWELAPTGPLDTTIVAGGRRWGGAVLFSSELDRWALIGSNQVQHLLGITRLYRGGLDGSFEPFSPLLVDNRLAVGNAKPSTVANLEASGASADLSAVVLRAYDSNGYLPGQPGSGANEPGGGRNSYLAFVDEAGEPGFELLARDKEGIDWGGRCGAYLGGPGKRIEAALPAFARGAISTGGERVYFTTRPAQPFDEETGAGPPCDLDHGTRVMKRTATPAGPVIAEIAPGGPEAPGDDLFQAASADGTKVYFLSPRKLTPADTDADAGPCRGTVGQSKGCDLYLYDESRPEGERTVLASDAEGAEEANVLNSTAAISGDGSRAYFVAQGALTSDANPKGDTAQAGEPNLYLYEADTDSLSFLATLSPQDASGMWDVNEDGFGDAFAVPRYGASEEDGGDGHVLAFASKAPITADDEDGGYRDVFRYDAQTETLERISKAPEEGSDNGPYDASVNPAWFEEHDFNLGEMSRWASEDGQTIAFATKEALIPSDEDGLINPYVSEDGLLGAVFAPLFDQNGETRPPAVAPTGGQIAFSTTARLLPVDTDVAEDVYVARADGGFQEAVQPTVCDPLQEGSCRQKAPAPQSPAAPASTAFNGPGNAKEPPRCRKGQVKRRGKCVKRARKGKVGKRAGHNRGGRS